MAAAELAALEADMRENGQLIPILMRGREIIDGRKRWAACRRIGIEPKIVQIGKRDPRSVARSANLLRTHYTPSQRAMYAAKLANATRGNPPSHRTITKFGDREVTTVREAADALGVAHGSVGQAKRILRDAAPEVAEAVQDGSITVHAATRIADAVPKDKQAAAVEKIKSSGLGNRKRSVTAILGGAKPRKMPVAPASDKVENALRSIETALEVLSENWNLPDAAHSSRRAAWVGSLRGFRLAITRMTRAEEGQNGNEEVCSV